VATFTFDHQCELGTTAPVLQDPHVSEPRGDLENFGRVAKDEGVFWLLSHNSN